MGWNHGLKKGFRPLAFGILIALVWKGWKERGSGLGMRGLRRRLGWVGHNLTWSCLSFKTLVFCRLGFIIPNIDQFGSNIDFLVPHINPAGFASWPRMESQIFNFRYVSRLFSRSVYCSRILQFVVAETDSDENFMQWQEFIMKKSFVSTNHPKEKKRGKRFASTNVSECKSTSIWCAPKSCELTIPLYCQLKYSSTLRLRTCL